MHCRYAIDIQLESQLYETSLTVHKYIFNNQRSMISLAQADRHKYPHRSE